MVLCQNCNDSFEPRREWQLFCCTGCKRKYNYTNREICFYCGEEGIQRDHIHPFSARPGEERKFATQEIVYACQECNTLLSNTIFSDVAERVEYLIAVFIKRYNLDKPHPRWDDEDLEEMGVNLRSSIKRSLKERHAAECRLMYMKIVRERLVKALNEEVE